MPSVTKSKSGKYYEQERLWEEARQCRLPPFYIGTWRGSYKIPPEPSKGVFSELARGLPLARVQKNRVAVFDHTFSWDKSVTIATYGMTPPEKWGEWSKEFAAIVRKVLEPRLDSQIAKTGAQGKDQEPSKGLALALNGWRGAFGQLHAHVHGVVFNLTATKDGKAYSWGNSHESFRDQGLMRAVSNKLMDDLLRSKGFKTVRKGKLVTVAGVPDDMVRALSPSREAMEGVKPGKGRKGPRAKDFAAAKANREGKKVTGDVTPQQAYDRCQVIAGRYGLTPEKLRSAPSSTDPVKAGHEAYAAAIEARDECTKRYGNFTEQQFLKWVYTHGIGRDTTFDALTSTAKLMLKSRQYAGIEKTQTEDGQVRYHAMPTPEVELGGPGKAKGKGPQPDPRETAKAAERPYVREAWGELTKAVKGLGAAVLVTTAKKATDVVSRVSEYVNPAPKTLRIDAADLDRFLVTHHRTSYAAAHLKAVFKGVLAGGNPHRMAGAAEKTFERLRAYTPIPKNTVIVVERGQLATADQLRKLAKIAKRDKCSVVLSERAEPEKAFARPKRAARQQKLRQTLKEHGFRPGRDRVH